MTPSHSDKFKAVEEMEQSGLRGEDRKAWDGGSHCHKSPQVWVDGGGGKDPALG